MLRQDTAEVEVDDQLSFIEQPEAIIARDVRKLRTKEIPVVKIRWARRPVEEATWEIERDMRTQYPHLFDTPGTFLSLTFGGKSPI